MALFTSKNADLSVHVDPLGEEGKPRYKKLADGSLELLQEESFSVQFRNGRLDTEDEDQVPKHLRERAEFRIRRDAAFGTRIFEITAEDLKSLKKVQNLEEERKQLEEEKAKLETERKKLEEEKAAKDAEEQLKLEEEKKQLEEEQAKEGGKPTEEEKKKPAEKGGKKK